MIAGGKGKAAATGLVAGLLLAAAAQAQEATVYRDAGYRGPAVSFSSANPDTGMRFTVGAIRVKSGLWELCPATNFRGTCIQVGQDVPNLFQAYGWASPVGSIRPVGGSSGGGSGGGVQSLRGMASEYFPAPSTRGSRVLACRFGSATAQCAKNSANDFCRSAGWAGSAYQRIETVRGQNYLADVLCVRSGY